MNRRYFFGLTAGAGLASVIPASNKSIGASFAFNPDHGFPATPFNIMVWKPGAKEGELMTVTKVEGGTLTLAKGEGTLKT